MSQWKDHSIKVLQEVFAEAIQGQWSVEEFKQRSSAAYPFGERAYNPYKVWLYERKRFMAIFQSTSWWNKEQYQEKGGGQ